jgi:hypothetical protein
MGQYFVVVILDEKNNIITYFDIGKLMCSAIYGDNTINEIYKYICPESKYYNKCKVIWSGDYADNFNGKQNLYQIVTNPENNIKHGLIDNQVFVATNLDTGVVETHSWGAIAGSSDIYKNYRYLINHTQKLYVDLIDDKKKLFYYVGSRDDAYIPHPLPLLVCEGNGRGLGDYYAAQGAMNTHLCGKWIHNNITIENNIPFGYLQLTSDYYKSDIPDVESSYNETLLKELYKKIFATTPEISESIQAKMLADLDDQCKLKC